MVHSSLLNVRGGIFQLLQRLKKYSVCDASASQSVSQVLQLRCAGNSNF